MGNERSEPVKLTMTNGNHDEKCPMDLEIKVQPPGVSERAATRDCWPEDRFWGKPGIPCPGVPCIARKSQKAVPLMGALSTALAASGQACRKEERVQLPKRVNIRRNVRKKRENRRQIALLLQVRQDKMEGW